MGESESFDLLDDRLFEYPWLYATQTGYWDLSDAELDRLREYLLRGGFLMCDDFWGEDDGRYSPRPCRACSPTRPMVELHGDEAVLHVVYGIDEFTQIPGLRHLRRLDSLPPPQLVRHLRRQPPADGRHQLQPGRGRFLGRSRTTRNIRNP